MIGTNTRQNPMTPKHHGVCIVCRMNRIIILRRRNRRLICSPKHDPLPTLVRKVGRVPQRGAPSLTV